MFFCWRVRMVRTEVITGFLTGPEFWGVAVADCWGVAWAGAEKKEAVRKMSAERVAFIGYLLRGGLRPFVRFGIPKNGQDDTPIRWIGNRPFLACRTTF
jgi:hypothetical protein